MGLNGGMSFTPVLETIRGISQDPYQPGKFKKILLKHKVKQINGILPACRVQYRRCQAVQLARFLPD
jgi:hypothetical protein